MAVTRVPRGEPAIGDAELLARIAAGDPGALGALYQRHRADVRAFVLRATAYHDDAEDVLHDTFLLASRIAARYDGRASCRPWLVGIAARLVLQRRQRLARIGRYLARLGSSRRGAHDPTIDLEARGDLERALGRIAAGKRVVIVMAELEGMTCAEIAEQLAIPIGTVWTRLHHARKELLAILEAR